jgi:hypothetical protein
MNGTFDENLNFYNGIKFPFELDGVSYSFFVDNVTKNFGKIPVIELLEKYVKWDKENTVSKTDRQEQKKK